MYLCGYTPASAALRRGILDTSLDVAFGEVGSGFFPHQNSNINSTFTFSLQLGFASLPPKYPVLLSDKERPAAIRQIVRQVTKVPNKLRRDNYLIKSNHPISENSLICIDTNRKKPERLPGVQGGKCSHWFNPGYELK
jgi:hypothetical protein